MNLLVAQLYDLLCRLLIHRRRVLILIYWSAQSHDRDRRGSSRLPELFLAAHVLAVLWR